MSGQVFALIIGIDKYQAGNIWNLNAAADDARSIEHWLINDFQVPRNHICTLIDSQATKRNIEDRFMSHFVNNPAIEPGDALILYYAGHGSSIRAPPGWFDHSRGDVSVLCTYDYDTKLPNGKTNAGISDRSLRAMLQDLARVKGDNITLILDTCFSLPPTEDDDPKERRYTRYTPTRKASPEDLLAGLWRSASPQKSEPIVNRGFTGVTSNSHVVLAACGAGWPATERKDGGNFTRALLALKDARALHKLTYADLPHELAPHMGDHQHAACAGTNVDRILFDAVPFPSDGRFVAVSAHDAEHVQVDAGEMHGVAVGTEFALHPHNRRGSLNVSLGSYVATQVFPTWCLARPKSSSGKHAGHHHLPRDAWARVTRWNNPAPFRVHVGHSLSSFFRRARLVSKLPAEAADCDAKEDVTEKSGVRIVRVEESGEDEADLSVRLRRKELVAERHDPLMAANCRETRLNIPSGDARTDLKTIESAARFHLHLYRRHPARPFAGKVSMELYRLDPCTWARASGNLLVKGRARLAHSRSGGHKPPSTSASTSTSTNENRKGTGAGAKSPRAQADAEHIYAVVLRNDSDADLWPYLAYMDAGGYAISVVYHPDPAACAGPPLKRHSHMVIGSGSTESEALSFALGDGAERGEGFLKLFVSTAYTPMTILEQGRSMGIAQPWGVASGTGTKGVRVVPDGALWDSVVASITVVQTGE